MDKYSDVELLSELLKRNKLSPAPCKIELYDTWYKTTVGISKDTSCSILIDDAALDALGVI